MRVRKITSLQRLLFFCLFLAQTASFSQSVTGISPNNVTHRSTVLINGSGFTSTSAVRFYTGTDATVGSASVAATAVTFVNANQLRVIVPAVVTAGGAAVTRSLRVFNGSVSSQPLTYTYTPPATTPANAGITRVITNYNGYWSSAAGAQNALQPDLGHSLMAFRYNGTLYSTGTESAVTDVLASNAATGAYTQGNWRALPIRNIAGNVPAVSASNPNLIVLAGKIDGSETETVPTAPSVTGLSVRDVLIDGIRGLNIGTGVTNLPASSVLTFEAGNIRAEVVEDAVPDIMVSQIADPSDNSFSVYCFLDEEGNIVGKPVQVALNGITAVGTYKTDFFTLPAGQTLNTATVNGKTTIGGTTRPIRLVAYRLTDFGITEDNKDLVKQFKVMPSGTSDPGFMAYNRNSFSIPAPEISGQPQSVAKCPGETATFTVSLTATGTELEYRWEKNGTALANGGRISGANTATLRITGITAADNGIYRCLVTNPGGAAFSNSAYLNTVVLSSTESATTCIDSPVTIEVNSNGNTPVYKWYSNTTNSTTGGALIADATTNRYAPPVNTAGTLYYYAETYPEGYECAITTSNVIPVTVSGAGEKGTISANQTVCPATPATVTLSGFTGTVQWQSTTEADGSSGWANITGATAATYTNNAVTGTIYYRAIVTNGGCPPVTSDVTSLTANSSYIWTGNTSTDWNTASNWSCNLVPTATVDVVIPAERENQPVVNNDALAHARSLVVNSGASLTIATGGSLQVVNEATVEDSASFVVENNGAFIQDNNTNNNGVITVKRDSNPLFRLDYTLWSSPVSGQSLRTFSMGTSNDRFYEYKYAYSESRGEYFHGYWNVDPLATYFTAGKSFLIRMPNSSSVSGYNQGSTTIIHPGIFTGTPYNGTIQVTLTTEGNRFTATGNPYASPINVAAFFDGNTSAIENGSAIYLWRKKNDTNAASYATVTKAAFVANSATSQITGETPEDYNYGGQNQAGYFSGNSSQWTLSQGQGFFVKAATGTVSQLRFTNSMRRPVPATGGQSFFREAQQNISRLWVNIADSNSGFSQAAVAYMEEATTGIDFGYDGLIMGDGISVYTISQQNELTIQARPVFAVNDVVQLGYKAITAGSHTLNLDRAEGVFTAGQKVYLKDNALGVVRELTHEGYTFTTDEGTVNDRFEIIYTTTALSTDNPVADADNIFVYKQNGLVTINSGAAEMLSVDVYDTRGRKIYDKNNINNTQTALNGLEVQQQVIIVTIKTVAGIVNKKVIF